MKNKTFLNISSFFIGALTMVIGLMKLLYATPKWSLYWGDLILSFETHNSILFIVLVNFIGGASLVSHAVSTFPFRKGEINSLKNEKIYTLSKLSGATGIVVLLMNIFLILEIVFSIVPLLKYALKFYPVLLLYLLILLPFSLIPLLLVIKNFKFNNKLLARKKYLRSKLLIESLKNQPKIR